MPPLKNLCHKSWQKRLGLKNGRTRLGRTRLGRKRFGKKRLGRNRSLGKTLTTKRIKLMLHRSGAMDAGHSQNECQWRMPRDLAKAKERRARTLDLSFGHLGIFVGWKMDYLAVDEHWTSLQCIRICCLHGLVGDLDDCIKIFWLPKFSILCYRSRPPLNFLVSRAGPDVRTVDRPIPNIKKIPNGSKVDPSDVTHHPTSFQKSRISFKKKKSN